MYQEMHEGPKRGVSIYSYSGEYGWSMDLEDCFADMRDMGAHGLENGHWIDSRLYAHDYMKNGRELNVEESFAQLERDIRLAHKLGFTVLRTKMGVIDPWNTPVKNWREIIRRALPMAEEYNVRMCPELHIPTRLKSAYVDEYMDFILQTNTKYFGFNVDFGTFQNVFEGGILQIPGMPENGSPCSLPEDIIPILPYVYCCHAKFNYMDENFEETTIPYRKIIRTLKDNHWDGYMLSEYEGPHKDEPGFVSDQLRRQHIMMKRILGF